MSAGIDRTPIWATKKRLKVCDAEVRKLRAKLASDPHTVYCADWANLGDCELYAGQMNEALWSYERGEEARQVDARKLDGPNSFSASYSDRRATVHLLGQQIDAATRELRTAMDGIKSRKVKFADAAGGVTPGLLLWYVAVSQSDASLEAEALTYLRLILKRKKRYDLWPRQLAELVLGDVSFNDLLQGVFKSTDLDDLGRRAMEDRPPPEFLVVKDGDPPEGFLLRRELARALFYGGMQARRTDPPLGNALLKRCTSLPDVGIECEWYLAFLELGLVK